MNNYNIERDRPKVSSEEIAQKKDFDSVLENHQIMNRPFFKSSWFFGVTGMASLSLLIAGAYSFTSSDLAQDSKIIALNTNPPPDDKTETVSVFKAKASLPLNVKDKQELAVKLEPKVIKVIDKKAYDNKPTLDKTKVSPKPIESKSIKETLPLKKKMEVASLENINVKHQPIKNFRLASQPRIAGQFGGKISRANLRDKRGVYTELDLIVSGFELHAITASGSQVLKSNNYQLTPENVSFNR